MKQLIHYLFSADRLRLRLLSGAMIFFLTSNVVVAEDLKSVFMVLWRGETKVEEGFREYFAEQGISLDLTVVSLNRNTDNIAQVLGEIRVAKPDLIYTWGTSTTLGIAGRDPKLDPSKEYPPQILDIPIVFTMVSQPIKSKIVHKLGPTGRNVTGVTHLIPIETQVEAMRDYMPVDRIAVIYSTEETNSILAVEQLIEFGDQEGIKIDAYPAPLGDDERPSAELLPDLIAKVAESGPQFLYLGPDSFIGENAKMIADAANAVGLPTFASTERSLVSSNALYGLVAPYSEVGKMTARKVEQILFEGMDVSTVPVDILRKFSYKIRIDVARELGIFPSISLMDYAEIIEKIE